MGIVGEVVAGYYTLAVGQVTLENAPERLKKGLAKHPVPIMLLVRLAVGDWSHVTVYRRSKDSRVLQRVEWLLTQHKLVGDLVARLNWGRIAAGQVKAAIAGDTRAAHFCRDRAWPEDKQPRDFFLK